MRIHQDGWQRVGVWWGGAVSAVALSPTFARDGLALAATGAGLFRSTDGGETWAAVHAGMDDPLLLTVAFAPPNADGSATAYVTTATGRLYTSSDGGKQWQEVVAWAGLGVAVALAFSPDYAADGTLFAATNEGVFRSQDHAQRWESSTFGLHDLDVLCLAVAPDFASNEVLWAGAAQGGFYRSRNGARSWRDAGEGLPDDAFTCLLISPQFAADQTLYLGTEQSGLYRSTDGGMRWTPVAGVAPGLSLLSLALAGDQLLLGTPSGLLLGQVHGEAWRPAHGGAFAALSLAVAEPVVLAATPEGIYRSPDGGNHWEPANQGLTAHAPPVVQRVDANTLLALDGSGALARWSAGELAWQPIGLPQPDTLVTAFAVQTDRAGAQIIAATATGDLYTGALQPEAIIDWNRLGKVSEADVAVQQLVPIWQGDGLGWLVVSADQQLYHWAGSGEGKRLSVPWAGETLLQLACTPTINAIQRWVAITARPNEQQHFQLNVWESRTAGAAWEPVASLTSELPAVALALADDLPQQSLFLATRNRLIRIFQPQAGQALASEQHFLAEGVNITALALSPHFATDRQLWAATNRGVYGSADGGETWVMTGEEGAGRPLVALFADDPGLLAIALGGTVWQQTHSTSRQ
jgi:photosystem II stability/assembly factor-like uncharacterized protein